MEKESKWAVNILVHEKGRANDPLLYKWNIWRNLQVKKGEDICEWKKFNYTVVLP